MKKIVVLSTFAYSLLNLRGDMMEAMAELGHRNHRGSPRERKDLVRSFWAEGFPLRFTFPWNGPESIPYGTSGH